MNKLIDIFFSLFLLFLISNSIWPMYKALNYIFIILFLILSIVIVLKSDKKKIRIDKIDILLGLLPIFYLIPYILGRNVNNISDYLYYLLFEFVITFVIIIMRRFLNKERLDRLLVNICMIGGIYFFVTFIYQIVPKEFMLVNIFSHFGDTYVNSIDRFYGTLNYCNASALLFLISSFIALFKIGDDKENKCIFRILFYINFVGFLSTFSKMLFLAFILILIVLIGYCIVYKKYNILSNIKINFISIILPSVLFLHLFRSFLINLNFIFFIIVLLLLIGLYLGLCKLFDILEDKFKYLIYIYFILIAFIFIFLLLKPISTSLKINHIYKSNEYIITDFILDKNKEYNIKFNVNGEREKVTFRLCKLYVSNNVPKIKMVKEIAARENNEFKVKTDNDFEYYFIKVVGLNKKSDFKISNLKINDKDYLINSLLVPYQYIHQLELTKYDRESVSHRFLYYKDSFNVLKENGFIIGHGFDSFAYYADKNNFDYLERDPHSYLFQLWLDVGIYGVLYIIGLIVFGIINMIKYREEESKLVWFCIFSLCMMVLPFDCIYSIMFDKVLLLLSFIVVNLPVNMKKKRH